MARPCTVCAHPDLEAINRAIVDLAGNPKRFRLLAGQYGLGHKSLERHGRTHLTPGLARATVRHAELVEETRQLDVLACLGRAAEKGERMLEAIDTWLRDPVSGRYNLDPRASEIQVIWQPLGGGPRQKARLSELLERIERVTEDYVRRADLLPALEDVAQGFRTPQEALEALGGPALPRRQDVLLEAKVADPRKLLGEVATAFRPVLELIGKATGQIQQDEADRKHAERLEALTRIVLQALNDDLPRDQSDRLRTRILLEMAAVRQ